MLAQPPTPRLAVPPPANALLPDAASRQFAGALAAGLQAQEVPAVADKVRTDDWQLVATAGTAWRHRGADVHRAEPEGRGQGQGRRQPGAHRGLGRPPTRPRWTRPRRDAAPKIAALLTGISTHARSEQPVQPRRQGADARPVTGAPGDGNTSLTKQMRTHLAALGPVVQDTANGADFIVQGNVRMVPIAGGQQRVEIQWVVKSAQRRRARQGGAAQRDPGGLAQPLLGRRRRGGGDRGRRRRERRHHPPVRPGAWRAGSWTGPEAVGRRPHVRCRADPMTPSGDRTA